jgi:glutamate 5-kinase
MAAEREGLGLAGAGHLLGGRSPERGLLPIGVVGVTGTFHKGDVGALCAPDGVEFARGLTNYKE